MKRNTIITVNALLLLFCMVGTGMAQYVAPPEPKFTDAQRVAELKSRRDKVIERIGKNSAMILFSGVSRVYTGDVEYPFRQENNLYYLTNVKQEGIALVLIPGATKTKEILFIGERVPSRETWTGRMIAFDEARALTGIQDVWDIKLLPQFLAYLMPQVESGISSFYKLKDAKIAPPSESTLQSWNADFQSFTGAVKENTAKLFMLASPNRPWSSREFKQELEFSQMLTNSFPNLKIELAEPVFAELRIIKSPMEIALIQHAVDITREAFDRVYRSVNPNMSEADAHAEFEYTFTRRHADSWGYPCIVGGGENATTLHYITNQEKLDDNSLLLMDCSAEYDHYTGDITRTIPVNGKFSKEQAEIYKIVYDAQMEGMKASKPGNFLFVGADKKPNPETVNARVATTVREGLFKLGLITSKDNNEYRFWYMHGCCHGIGMNVHDVGDFGKPFAPGMTFTIEPGIYIRPDALEHIAKDPKNKAFVEAVRPAFEKYKGIGVRIEDDILITSDGYKNMSAAIPSKLEEVETAMANSKLKNVKSTKPQKTASTKF